MPLPNNEFIIPDNEATLFDSGDQLDFHKASEGTAPFEPISLAREAVNRATTVSAELEGPSLVEQISRSGQRVTEERKRKIDSTLDIYDDKTAPRASMVKKALSLLTGTELPKLFVRPTNERSLIQAESKIGAQLFGEVSAYSQREFFCLDESTWIWYESQQDAATGNQTEITTRYEVHPNGILKAQEGSHYSYLESEELENLRAATQLYADQVLREIYNPLPDVA